MALLLERESSGPLSWGQVKAGFWDSLAATRDETFAQNPMNQLRRIDELGSANSVGDPTAPEYVAPTMLPAADARTRATQAGVKLKISDQGISEHALDVLITRQKDQQAREKALTQGPDGFAAGAARLGVAFAASAMDPLNIASAFVPVIPEARAAAWLAERGMAARIGIRAGVGAAEGAVGQALLEPLALLSNQRDQADYTMGNSLQNIAFGGLFGSGVHILGGALMDAAGRGLPKPKAIDLAAPIVPRETADFRPVAEPGAAAINVPPGGFAEAVARVDPAVRAQEIYGQMRRGELTEADVRALVKSEPDAMGVISASLTREGPDAPAFARLTPEAARARAIAELSPDLKAELLGTAGGRADPGAVPALRAEVARLSREVEALQSEGAFKTEAKALQQGGMSRKQAESGARKALADRQSEARARIEAAEAQLETNRAAAEAEQHIASIDKGQVPDQFADRVAERTAQIQAAADIHAVFNPPPAEAARFRIGQADWQTRQAAFKTALGQAMDGKQINVDPVFGAAPGARQPMTPEQVTAAGQRQAQPEAARVADFQAAKAADEKLAAAPKGELLVQAEEMLAKEDAKLKDTLTNLEQSGMDKARVTAMTDSLKPFDDALKDADSMGAGLKAAAMCGVRQ